MSGKHRRRWWSPWRTRIAFWLDAFASGGASIITGPRKPD